MNSTAADWFPDPSGMHQFRWWDGYAWTEHVSDNGVNSVDPLPPAGATHLDDFESNLSFSSSSPETIQRQVRSGGFSGANIHNAAFEGSGSVFAEPILVVNQKAKLIEINSQYAVYDQNGNQIAVVNQIGQSTAKKIVRLVANIDQFLTHKLEIRDMAGRVLLRLTRPAKIVKSTIIVSDANDVEFGRIVQQNAVGKIRFSLESAGVSYGEIKAENWRAWNFRIEDHAGVEIARITKTFEGLARTVFTTADNYVVQIHTQLPQPLNALVVAAALSVDTALKQDSRGLS